MELAGWRVNRHRQLLEFILFIDSIKLDVAISYFYHREGADHSLGLDLILGKLLRFHQLNIKIISGIANNNPAPINRGK